MNLNTDSFEEEYRIIPAGIAGIHCPLFPTLPADTILQVRHLTRLGSPLCSIRSLTPLNLHTYQEYPTCPAVILSLPIISYDRLEFTRRIFLTCAQCNKNTRKV